MHAARARAPVRLDFAGGWTDVPPFSASEGGVVVTAAIQLYAHAEVRPGGSRFRLIAEDLNQCVECDTLADLGRDAPLELHRAALRLFLPLAPLTLVTRCDVPKGSGLGSSGALDVALVAALSAACGVPLHGSAAAEAGWRLEAIEAGIAGGRQDQYAAALGGFQRLEFADPDVRVAPLALDPAWAAELERRILLCYTGASRFSGATITRVMAAYERGEPAVVAALQRLRDIAVEMADALVATDLARVGRLLEANWRAQRSLDPAMSTPAMERLEAALRGAGALGGKAAGSGAGGCMFFLAGDDVPAARDAARRAGAELLPVAWAPAGARAW